MMHEQEETVECHVPPEKRLEGCSAGIENTPTTSQADQAESSPSTSNSVQLKPTQSHLASPISIRLEIKSTTANIREILDQMDELQKNRNEIDFRLRENQTQVTDVDATDVDATDNLQKRKEELNNQLKENRQRIFDEIEELGRRMENEQSRIEEDCQRVITENFSVDKMEGQQRQIYRQILEMKQQIEHIDKLTSKVQTNTEMIQKEKTVACGMYA